MNSRGPNRRLYADDEKVLQYFPRSQPYYSRFLGLVAEHSTGSLTPLIKVRESDVKEILACLPESEVSPTHVQTFREFSRVIGESDGLKEFSKCICELWVVDILSAAVNADRIDKASSVAVVRQAFQGIGGANFKCFPHKGALSRF